jgi:hypothetical protein
VDAKNIEKEHFYIRILYNFYMIAMTLWWSSWSDSGVTSKLATSIGEER